VSKKNIYTAQKSTATVRRCSSRAMQIRASICRCAKQVLPKVIWEERVATPHGREWTRPLRVLLAAQYPLQTNPITQLRLRYV